MNRPLNCNHFVIKSATEAEIQESNDQIRRGENPCNLPECSVCGSSPDKFKRHDKRGRIYYIITEEQLVKAIEGLIARWRCPFCNKKSTDSPDFAVPNKHYTLPTILSYCGYYVNTEPISYRNLTDGQPAEYEAPSKTDDIFHLSHTTIFRWTATLGGFTGIIRKAQDLILQMLPTSSICRDLASLFISPQKYVKAYRKKLLYQCRRLVHLEKNYEAAFGVSIFPRLATRCRFS